MNPVIKISEQIAKIRLEPEHIRLRYVWGAVAISMLFILAIWIFSIGSLFQGEKNTENQGASDVPGITEQIQILKEQAPSIKDFAGQSSTSGSEGIDNTQGAAAPQANTYSDLQAGTPAQ